MENNIVSVNQISFENIRTFNIQIISKYFSLVSFVTYNPFDSLIFPPSPRTFQSKQTIEKNSQTPLPSISIDPLIVKLLPRTVVPSTQRTPLESITCKVNRENELSQ